jgi:hypothetical protein
MLAGVHENMKNIRFRSGWMYSLWKRLRKGSEYQLCKDWKDDFVEFHRCISKIQKPPKGYTLKPIDKALGYCGGNVHIVPFNYKGGVTRDGNLIMDVGDTFNSWVLLENSDGMGTKDKILCKCTCGVERRVLINNLISLKTMGCGCGVKVSKYKRRDYQTEYSSYVCMMERCYNVDSPHYKRYGGSGVTVCDEWATCFENFMDDMG